MVHMKRIIATGSVAALALFGFAGTASAFEPGTPQCFGQVHKFVNSGGLEDIENVGQLVKALGGGQAKNMAAKGFCTPA
jgi:dienelactone hydrolase